MTSQLSLFIVADVSRPPLKVSTLLNNLIWLAVLAMNSIVGVLCSAWCLSSPITIQMLPWETSRYSSSSLPKVMSPATVSSIWVNVSGNNMTDLVDRECYNIAVTKPFKYNIIGMSTWPVSLHQLCMSREVRESHLTDPWHHTLVKQTVRSHRNYKLYMFLLYFLNLINQITLTNLTCWIKFGTEYGGGKLVGGWRSET